MFVECEQGFSTPRTPPTSSCATRRPGRSSPTARWGRQDAQRAPRELSRPLGPDRGPRAIEAVDSCPSARQDGVVHGAGRERQGREQPGSPRDARSALRPPVLVRAPCPGRSPAPVRRAVEVIAAKGYTLEPGASISKLNFLYGALIDRPVEERVPGWQRAGRRRLERPRQVRPNSPGRRAVLRGAGRLARRSHRVRQPQGPDAHGSRFLREELAAFARSLQGRGIDRIVQFGDALEFSSLWDGYDLLAELTRTVTIAQAPTRSAGRLIALLCVWETASPPPSPHADLLPPQPPRPELPDLLQGAGGRAAPDRQLERARTGQPRPAAPRARADPATASAGRAAGPNRLTVRRVARGADDGYRSPLVIGLKSGTDAGAAGRGAGVRRPPAAAARARPAGALPRGRRRRRAGVEERSWLAFLIAYLCPLEGEDPFAEIERVRTSWGSGELPSLDGVQCGPRSAHDPARGDEDARGVQGVGGAVRLAGVRVHGRRRLDARAPVRAGVRAAVAPRPASRRAVRSAGDARAARRLRHAGRIAGAGWRERRDGRRQARVRDRRPDAARAPGIRPRPGVRHPARGARSRPAQLAAW